MRLGVSVTAGLVLLLAAFGGDFAVHVATRICVFAIAAIGLDLVSGWMGQVSLGHAAFLGLGAYGHVLLVNAGAPAPIGLLGAAALAGAFGLLLGLPALRLFGPYVAVASLGFQMMCEQLWLRTPALTGGRMGLAVTGARLDVPFGERGRLVVCFAIAAAVALLTARRLAGPTGRRLLALRDEPEAAAALGVDPVRARVQTFAVSAALTGLAGALFVNLTDTLHPEQFDLTTSIDLLVMVVVGGAASVGGAVLGAVLLGLLAASLGELAGLQTAASGGILLLTVLFLPGGLARAGRRR